MKTVFLFIPHYVFSSDLLRTKYISYLANQYKVIVFSPVFEARTETNYIKIPNAEYIIWNEEHPRFWNIFTKLLRVSLIREFDNLEYYKLRHLTKANLNWQRKVIRKIGWFIPRLFLTTHFFTAIEKLLMPCSKKLQTYINKYNPSIVLTCTPGFSFMEAEAIIMAKKNNLKTVAIDSSWDNFTSNAIQFRKTDYIICWNEVMKKEAIRIHGYTANKVFVSGIYRFDHYFENQPNEIGREAFLKNKGLDPKLKTLLLCTVPPNTYPHQYKVWKEIIDKRDQLKENVNIFIRLHPNDLPEKYKELNGIKNLHIELAGKPVKKLTSTGHKIELDETDLENLRYSLKYTDVNINFRSSLTLESTIYNKPIINIALYDYTNRYNVDWYIPIIKSNGITLVKSTEELTEAINKYLENPELNSLGREKIFADYIGFTDGLSFKRSVDFIEKII